MRAPHPVPPAPPREPSRAATAPRARPTRPHRHFFAGAAPPTRNPPADSSRIWQAAARALQQSATARMRVWGGGGAHALHPPWRPKRMHAAWPRCQGPPPHMARVPCAAITCLARRVASVLAGHAIGASAAPAGTALQPGSQHARGRMLPVPRIHGQRSRAWRGPASVRRALGAPPGWAWAGQRLGTVERRHRRKTASPPAGQQRPGRKGGPPAGTASAVAAPTCHAQPLFLGRD